MPCFFAPFKGLCVFALTAAPALASLPTYYLTDLGPATGWDRAAINNAGVVTWTGPSGPVLWQNGVTTVLPLGSFAGVYGINDNNDVCGFRNGAPVTYINGVMAGVPGLPQGYSTGINNSGQVISQHSSNAYFTSGGVTTTLNVSGRTTYAEAINNSGVVVGGAADSNSLLRAFAWSNGTMTTLNLPGALGQTRATAINDLGSIAGGGASPWLRSGSGVVTTLGQPINDNLVVPLGINSSDQVVGYFRQVGGGFRALVWDGTTPVQLTSLVNAPGWILETAYDINDSGVIVGLGKLNGVDHAYMLSTIPAPATVVTTALAGLFLGSRRARRSYVRV